MIPDGTATGILTASRWYRQYQGEKAALAVDPYLCGSVNTFSLNAPIGDSAPTTSCYMTGIPQREGNISIYPLVDSVNDLVSLDPSRSYQPLVTILEAMKYQQQKATGLVVTAEFPHATPADCAAHHYSRKEFGILASQMAYNNLDIVFGGGTGLITEDISSRLQATGTLLLKDDVESFRRFDGKEKIWALFGEKDIPYDLDRDSMLYPSLAEMTDKAICRLNQDENGFFLMVEGSRIDWAAHANDVVGCISEYLAFDKAVEVAIDFARKDGETAVVVLPDHATGGFSIGRRGGVKYNRITLEQLLGKLPQYKRTAKGLEEILSSTDKNSIKAVFRSYTSIELNEEQFEDLLSVLNKKEADYMEISNGKNLESTIAEIMNSYTYFGFTSGGHTGEDVFLSVYHPAGESSMPVGKNSNVEINKYLFDLAGLDKTLEMQTREVFSRHQDVFFSYSYFIDRSNEFPVLIIKKGKNTLKIPAFKSEIFYNEKRIDVGSVVVYIDKNETFYLPSRLRDYLL